MMLINFKDSIFKANEIDLMFLVSNFQKIGEGIFHFSLFFNITQVWSFWKRKAGFLVYSIIDIIRVSIL